MITQPSRPWSRTSGKCACYLSISFTTKRRAACFDSRVSCIYYRNTIGYWYWFARYFFQCCFYALVLIASLMQVYYPQPSQLVGLFIAITIMAIIFIWLEVLQAARSPNRYTK